VLIVGSKREGSLDLCLRVPKVRNGAQRENLGAVPLQCNILGFAVRGGLGESFCFVPVSLAVLENSELAERKCIARVNLKGGCAAASQIPRALRRSE
jgi:hypothetical protein